MALSMPRRVGAGLAAGAVVAGVTVAAATASAAVSSGPGPLVPVQAGMTAGALPGGTPFGTTPASTPETVSFVLRGKNLGQLEAAVSQGQFHSGNFLSVGQFASQYGQPETAAALVSYLAKFGITAKTYADQVDVTATGTAGQFDSALSVTQQQYHVPALRGSDGNGSVPAQTVHAVTGAPRLPASIAANVLSVLGLTNYSAFTSQASHAVTQGLKTTAGAAPADNPAACQAATGLPEACHLPSDFASRYGLTPLYGKANGSGQTIAIVTLAALDQGAPQYFWQNVAGVPDTGRTVTVNNVDGGPGAPGGGSNETDLDVEQSGALAPGANVVVYQAPNTDYGFADTYFAAASDNTASTVSASWAESETYLAWSVADHIESPGYAPAFDEAFLELAAQGQSNFAASGDWAAYTGTADLGTTSPSVAVSADSPYVTAAGGTTLPWSATFKNSSTGATANISVPAERTWAWDYLWQPFATLHGKSYAAQALSMIIGSGGGYSSIETRPSYQDEVPGIGRYNAINYLTPTNDVTEPGTSMVEPTSFTVNPAPTVTSGSSSGRAVPDVSADADPYTGYLLYAPSLSSSVGAGWGGTSFVAPQLNGSTAEIDSYLGHRIGLWNPAIYALAAGGHSPFTPLNAVGAASNNLLYTGGGPGSLYNPGSGLGTPDLGKLAAELASRS